MDESRAGLSFDRNSKDVEIVSEMYLQSVQVHHPLWLITEVSLGSSEQQKGTVAKANQHLFSDFDAVTLPSEEQEPPESRSIPSWARGDVLWGVGQREHQQHPSAALSSGHKPIQPQVLPAPAAAACPDVQLLFLSVNKESANQFQG